jgi:hypothetical protein
MAISLNLSGVQARSFEPLPEGKYLVEVLEVKAKIAASSGAPMLAWTFRVLDEDYEGRQLFTNTVLTDNSLWKLKSFLIALGYTEEELNGEIELDPDELVGLQAVARVKTREYQGETRNDVNALEAVAVAEPSTAAE